MINAQIEGTLYKAPKCGTTKLGHQFAQIVVKTPIDNYQSIMVSAITNDLVLIEELMSLSEGHGICLSGQFIPGVYIDKSRQLHPSAKMVAHALLPFSPVNTKEGS